MIDRRALLLVPMALIAGCGGSGGDAGGGSAPPPGSADAPGGPAGATPAASDFKVGLLTPGSLSDSGWNSLAGAGLKQIETELKAQTSHQSATESEAEEALRGFARDKVKLIFAHGAEYGEAAKRVAEEFPDTIILVSSGEVEGKNLGSLRFDLGEAAYLAGILAGALSKSGKGGQIGGMSFAPVKQAFELFEKGAQTVNPKFSAPITYLGSWSDANAGKEKALAMIRGGADILFQNADAAGEGVFQAVEENKAKGVLAVGSNANQNELKPELIACSAVLDVAKTFLTVAREVQAGTFKGGIFLEDLKSGNVYLAINPTFEARIPAEIKAKIKSAEEDIKSGKLKLIAK